MRLTFTRINKLLRRLPERINQRGEFLAEMEGFDRAYENCKAWLTPNVGWFRDDKKHPELNTQEAYAIAMDALSDACWRGHDRRAERMRQDEEAEKRGLYTIARAETFACFKDGLANCTPERCMCWRMADDRRGHCVLIPTGDTLDPIAATPR